MGCPVISLNQIKAKKKLIKLKFETDLSVILLAVILKEKELDSENSYNSHRTIDYNKSTK